MYVTEGLSAMETRHLYDVRAVAEPVLRTPAPLGIRSTSLVRSGTVTGDRITGRLLPGGGDWLLFDAAGIGHVDARYVIETDDGWLIQVFYNGRIVFRGDARERLRAGEPLDEDDVHIRAAPTFDAPEAYGWLNGVQAVAVGSAELGDEDTMVVRYRVFELL
jgi:hypothetical protein